MATACARLSEAKAGLTGSVRMRSASATSSFSSPLRSRPNTSAVNSPAADPRRQQGGGLRRADDGLGLIVGARRRGDDERAIGNGGFEAVIKLGAVENAVGAGRHHTRLGVGPGLPGRDQAQPRQAEIGHRARGGADILAELRLDQHHNGRRPLDPSLGLVCSCSGHGRSARTV